MLVLRSTFSMTRRLQILRNDHMGVQRMFIELSSVRCQEIFSGRKTKYGLEQKQMILKFIHRRCYDHRIHTRQRPEKPIDTCKVYRTLSKDQPVQEPGRKWYHESRQPLVIDRAWQSTNNVLLGGHFGVFLAFDCVNASWKAVNLCIEVWIAEESNALSCWNHAFRRRDFLYGRSDDAMQSRSQDVVAPPSHQIACIYDNGSWL